MKKYSFLLRSLIILLDVLTVNLVSYYFFSQKDFNISFITYITFFWLLIAYYTKFYNIYRYTHILKLLSLLVTQTFVFLLAFLSYFTIFKEGIIVNKQFISVFIFISIITFLKFFWFLLLKKYRLKGGDYRNVIIFGESKASKNIVSLFNQRQDLGYRFFGFFSDKKVDFEKPLGTIKDGLNFVLENNIDEIYCEINSVNSIQLNQIRTFSKNHKIDFKLIPENKAIYSKDFILEHYGTIPILKPKKLPFEKTETHIIKRGFDILFSFIVCFLILSWLLPILWLLVKTTSKGPAFFKQKRTGLNGEDFYCFKFRSMTVNNKANQKQVTKDDVRITKIGSYLRKTSLDELPQFFNVLKGDMSVVGPRPHMVKQSEGFENEIANYIKRNAVKPGITGLAQVRGYRGEIIKKADIDNRVRLDIFYIENWSFFLDIKIIFQTIFNIINGEEKAY